MVGKIDWLCFEFHNFPRFNLVHVGGKYVSTEGAHLYCAGGRDPVGSTLLSRELINHKSIYNIHKRGSIWRFLRLRN